MAYAGYLISVGNYNIPFKYIQAESYRIDYNSQDLDSYRDANGVLHRDALDNFIPKVEFNVPPMLDNTQVADLLGNIRANYINNIERKVQASVYIPELDDYVTQNMYFVDVSPEIYFANGNTIKYKAFRIAFVGYGD